MIAREMPMCYSDHSEPFGFPGDPAKCFGEPRSSPDDPDLARCLPKEKGQAVYVIGDSFAWAIQFAFMKATSLPVHSASWPCNREVEVEGAINPEVMPAALAKVIKPNDIVVFISNFWPSYSAHLNATKRVTSAHGAKLVILGTWPILPTDPGICLAMAQRQKKMGQASKCWQPKAKADERAWVFWKKAEMFLDENTFMLDLSSIMCTRSDQSGTRSWGPDPLNVQSGGCDMWIPGTKLPGYFDNAHVNHNMAHYMAKGICEFMETKFSLGQLS